MTSLTRRHAVGLLAASANAQNSPPDEGQQTLLRLLQANDATVSQILQQSPGRTGRGENIAALIAAYGSPQSAHHQSSKLLPPLERAAQTLLSALDADGLLDAGNLSSPPDTAFVVEATAAALQFANTSALPGLRAVQQTLTQFLQTVGAALVIGGIHTPNHRWVICAALARINALFPAARYVNRIDDWLGEGIYQDADGLFPERSPNYARVEVNEFLTIARLLNRPTLLAPVRRHLTANLHLMHPDGELETVHSRRQDQDRPIQIANFYLQYRYMAIHDQNPTFAAVARLIAQRPSVAFVEGVNPVIHFLTEPLLRRPLPAGGAIPADYRQVFANSQLVRIRHGQQSATIYGGNDQPLGIASGLASNPTFFSFRHGQAILNSIRMGGRFFSLGAFRAEGIRVQGKQIVLHQRYEAPYYEPLPKEHRNPGGDYPLTPAKDGRFWSKLDFPHRPMSHVQLLDQKVTITEKPGGFELDIEVTGRAKVPYLIELTFRPGGQFSGAISERTENKIMFLTAGLGQYRQGNDVIEFGPGQADHEVVNLSSHNYQAHGAQLRAAGASLYITGYTPFHKVLTIRGV